MNREEIGRDLVNLFVFDLLVELLAEVGEELGERARVVQLVLVKPPAVQTINAWNRTGETLHLHVPQTGDIVAATTFPPQSGRGTVTATPLPGAANVLCQAHPSWLTAYSTRTRTG